MFNSEHPLTAQFRPTVEGLGCELVHFDLSAEPKTKVLRFYIDTPNGVTVAQCSEVSRQLEGVIATQSLITDAYRIEVSSPGLDRPLKKVDHFQRFQGHTAKVHLNQPQADQHTLTGAIAAVNHNSIVLDTPVGSQEVDFTNISKARLAPQFEPGSCRLMSDEAKHL